MEVQLWWRAEHRKRRRTSLSDHIEQIQGERGKKMDNDIRGIGYHGKRGEVIRLGSGQNATGRIPNPDLFKSPLGETTRHRLYKVKHCSNPAAVVGRYVQPLKQY